MSVVLVLSDAVTAEQRGEIIRVIQQYGEWVTLSESSYAIHTDLPPEYLAQKLKERTGITEGLQILRVSSSYRGRAPAQVRQWLIKESERGRTDGGYSASVTFDAARKRTSYGSDEASG